jgi:hypothetical protein
MVADQTSTAREATAVGTLSRNTNFLNALVVVSLLLTANILLSEE